MVSSLAGNLEEYEIFALLLQRNTSLQVANIFWINNDQDISAKQGILNAKTTYLTQDILQNFSAALSL